MTVIPKPAVELLVDERLAGDADLVRQIEEGLLYLEQFYDRAEPPKAVRVRPADGAVKSVELSFSDVPDDPAAWVPRKVELWRFADPVEADVVCGRLFSSLLDKRSSARWVRINRLMEQLQAEEERERATSDAQ